MVEFPQESSVELQEDGSLGLKFSLTAGTYATAMLREIASAIHDVGPDESVGKSSSAPNQDEDDE
jgi:tRNA(Glu) U13 pseudouridine synthase TruD